MKCYYLSASMNVRRSKQACQHPPLLFLRKLRAEFHFWLGSGGIAGKLPRKAFSWKFHVIGIVQMVFSHEVSAITRMRQMCVKNASKMGQKWVLFQFGKEECSKMRQKCAEHLQGRTPFGRYRCKQKSSIVSRKLPIVRKMAAFSHLAR